jgi:hypothetical protein
MRVLFPWVSYHSKTNQILMPATWSTVMNLLFEFQFPFCFYVPSAHRLDLYVKFLVSCLISSTPSFCRELLRGPLYYVLVLYASTVFFWRQSPVGMIALSMMCAGDGRHSLTWSCCSSGLKDGNVNIIRVCLMCRRYLLTPLTYWTF